MYEGTLPIAKLQKLPCSGLGELLHINFITIEETIGLCKEPVIRNVLVMQDHFSKHVVAYVVKDQKARTAAKVLRSGYFGLFRGAPTYLLSDKGKSFTTRWWKTFIHCMVSRSSELPHITLRRMDKWSV